MATKRAFVGGNWKCNGTLESIAALVKTLNDGGDVGADKSVDVVLAPTALHAGYVKANIRPDFKISSQNLWSAEGYGAFTGELTGAMLADFGMTYSIIGHSERRHKVARETDDVIAAKTVSALNAGLQPIVCVGELLEEREANKATEVVTQQMKAVIDAVPKESWSKIVIAYEPVWAIGTGRTASAEEAEEMHVVIRNLLADALGEDVAESVRIIYGGSVKAANCESLIAMKNVDGFLVGGASLKPEFVDIVRAASKKFQ